MNYYFNVLKKYAVFSGRARRSEYWYFFLVNIICTYALDFIGGLTEIEILVPVYILILLSPSIAVGVRRMHDVGKSGWYLLIPLYNLILALTEGDQVTNKYGKNPKIIDSEENDPLYNVFLSLFLAAFIACAFYALISESKIIDGFQKHELTKTIIFVASFVLSYVFFSSIGLTNKNQKQTDNISPN